MKHDPIDLKLERANREAQEKLERELGQHILDMAAGRVNAEDPLLDLVQRAHEAEAEDRAREAE